MKMHLCGWQSARCLPLFEQLVCPGPVPDGVDFFFFLFLACLPLLILVMSRLLPHSRPTPARRLSLREDGQDAT